MVLIFDSLCMELLAIIVTIIVIYIARVKWCHHYWKRKGFPYLEPSFPFGNFENPLNKKVQMSIEIKHMYDEFKRMGVKYGGIYSSTEIIYMPVDSDIVKNIMQKDFNSFYERGLYYNEKDDPLSAHLFAISGPKWRRLRTKLTPTFTSGKMKMMFDTLVHCGDNMYNAIHNYAGASGGIEIKDVLARFTTDIIGSCAFGLDCNSFEHEDSEFRKYGKEIFKPFSKLRLLLDEIMVTHPTLAKIIGFKFTPSEVSEFFIKVIYDAVKYREANNVRRADMLQLLIDLKNAASDYEPITMLEIAAQAFVFFTAGFETSSTTMSFCLYELALNPDIQQNMRNEINNVLSKYDGKITYEAMMEMNYMSQVIDETLRKYPPLAFLTRRCVEDYRVPGTNHIIEKGITVFLPVLAFHHDPEYFPNPELFDPERFSEENKPAIKPFTYLPFGEGPRLCIGMRFGMMQTKVGLTILLKNFVISLNEKTSSPLNIDAYSFIYTAKDGIFLNLEKVNNVK